MGLTGFKDKLDESMKRIDNANNSSLSTRVKSIKELRVSTEIELKSIAHKTKISLKNLKSIENLDFDKLPSEPWRNSFITQYCECIENFSKKEN